MIELEQAQNEFQNKYTLSRSEVLRQQKEFIDQLTNVNIEMTKNDSIFQNEVGIANILNHQDLERYNNSTGRYTSNIEKRSSARTT